MLNSRSVQAAALLVIWLFSPVLNTPAAASPIGLSTSASWSAVGQSCASSGTSTADCTQTISFTDPAFGGVAGTGLMVAESSAEFGTLSVDLSAQLSINTASFLGASGASSFSDELTISGGNGTGFIQYLFSGDVSFASDQPTLLFQITHDGLTQTGFGSVGQFSSPTTFDYASPLLAFMWGQPFAFSGSLTDSILTSFGDSTHHGDIDVTLDGIRVFDANRDAVGTYAIRSAANAPYATVVPEPDSLFLLLIGLAFLVPACARFRTSRV